MGKRLVGKVQELETYRKFCGPIPTVFCHNFPRPALPKIEPETNIIYPTNDMEHSPSWEANSSLGSHENPLILRNPNFAACSQDPVTRPSTRSHPIA